MSFNSVLILIISFLLLTLGVVVVPLVLTDVGLGCLFEMPLSFLGRPVNFPLRTAFAVSHRFGAFCVHFHLFPETF